MLDPKSEKGSPVDVSPIIKTGEIKSTGHGGRVKPAKILVIDDEPEITDIVETFLENAGYEVKSENSSTIGIERAKSYLPDLVLLDIMMPFMDGYEICQELKRSEKTKSIPVVFLTGKDAQSDEGKSFQVGGILFIKKPFSCERLLEIVKVVLMTADKANK
ncbi:MAG: response regulator [Candidatus Zixiibacteriota bacterium]